MRKKERKKEQSKCQNSEINKFYEGGDANRKRNELKMRRVRRCEDKVQ